MLGPAGGALVGPGAVGVAAFVAAAGVSDVAGGAAGRAGAVCWVRGEPDNDTPPRSPATSQRICQRPPNSSYSASVSTAAWSAIILASTVDFTVSTSMSPSSSRTTASRIRAAIRLLVRLTLPTTSGQTRRTATASSAAAGAPGRGGAGVAGSGSTADGGTTRRGAGPAGETGAAWSAGADPVDAPGEAGIGESAAEAYVAGAPEVGAGARVTEAAGAEAPWAGDAAWSTAHGGAEVGAFAGAGVAAAGTGVACCGRTPGWLVGAEPAAADGASVPPTVSRRSIRSRRWSRPPVESSAPGSSIRAQISSSSRRGAVVPRISTSPLCTMSAQRDSVAEPSCEAWAAIRSIWSAGPSMRPFAAASGTCWITIRSRSRSSRSEANRRMSCPASATRSTVAYAAAPSPAASASHISSISAESVTPSSATARA
ncbi:hypothetical protein LAH08_04774 [Micromonospora noduli]|uniref:Uncharacterized protein n=1 Tax=Micromonospora noduli TaxID=709876 RepID=A0A328N556_9ACTN|nr:hypothetical protein LAH08_04774 [Micromonospora noduli]